eukprot:scaffold250655_cov17-Prasinocladus_malaysianus.AAC.1
MLLNNVLIISSMTCLPTCNDMRLWEAEIFDVNNTISVPGGIKVEQMAKWPISGKNCTCGFAKHSKLHF